MESCRAHDYTDLIMVHEHRGEPDGLVVCHLPCEPQMLLLLLLLLPPPSAAVVAGLTVLVRALLVQLPRRLPSARVPEKPACRRARPSLLLMPRTSPALHCPCPTADGPTAYFGVFNTVLRHDIGDKKQVGQSKGARLDGRDWACRAAEWRGIAAPVCGQ